MKHEAIYKLYPNVNSIDDKEDGSVVCFDENRNEVSIDMSAVNTKATELQTEADNKVDVKTSAKAKLMSGEALTEEEANTIVL
tara:strand:+ start:53 stop:301 length:249 start_codon:yes stop_codon:yes gene_type:complete